MPLPKGYKHTEESKRKISENNRVRKISSETKEKIRQWHLGRVLSEETKKKMSLSRIGTTHVGAKHSEEFKERTRKRMLGNTYTLGRKLSEEHKKKLKIARAGRVFSEETRLKMSESSKGRKHTDASKEKLRLAHKGKKLSAEHRAKLGEVRKGVKQTPEAVLKRKASIPRGKDMWNWKGGITPINQKIRHSFEYKLWRTSVFERDDYACVLCGAKNGNGKAVVLNADHIKPFAYFPELRFEISNGRTLCVPCHKMTETYGGKVKSIIPQ